MNLKIDILKENYQAIKIKQNTNVTLIIELLEDGTAFDISTKTIALHCVNSKGNVLIQGDNISKIGNVLNIDLMKDMTAIEGKMLMQIDITENNKNTASFKIPFIVDARVNSLGVVVPGIATDIITSLSSKVAEAIQVKESVENLIATSGAVTKGEFNNFTTATTGEINDIKTDVTNINNSKVDKVTGKMLSTNDYSNEEKLLVTKINDKRDKTTLIGMADFTQEVKQAFTGGSTAVVGPGAVNTVNMVDQSVDVNKLKDGNVTLKKVDITLNPIIKYLGAGIDTTYNGTEVTVTLKNAIALYDKMLTRKVTCSFGASTTYVMPNLSMLVWDVNQGINTVTVVNDGSSLSGTNCLILLRNENGQLTGELVRHARNTINYAQLMDNSIDCNKLHWIHDCDVRYNYHSIPSTYNVADGSITIQFTGNIVIYDKKGKQVFNKQFSPLGTFVNYTIPTFGALYLDLSSTGKNELFVRASNELNGDYNCIMLLANNASGIITGKFANFVLNNAWGDHIRDNTIRLAKLEKPLQDKINSLESVNDLPQYWIDHLKTKMQTIKNYEMQNFNSFSYAFLTDIHFDGNSKKFGKLLKYIDDYLNLSGILVGGDYITNAPVKADGVKMICDTMNEFGYVKRKTLPTLGNHDKNYDYTDLAKVFNVTELNTLIFSNFRDGLVFGDVPFDGTQNGGSLYCYKDDNVKKVRYISLSAYNCLDSINPLYDEAYTQPILQWLCEKALNVKDKVDGDKWSFVIITHPPMGDTVNFNPTPPHNSNILMNIFDSFKSKTRYNINMGGNRPIVLDIDFSTYKGNIIAMHVGHGHQDKSVQTTGGVNIIETTSDLWRNIPGRAEGNTTESAIDIVTVNPITKNIKITRIGYGNDRTFVY